MLQCLIASPKLSQYFREGLHAREVNKSTKTKGQIAVLFADLVSKANSGKPEEESPQELKDLICKAAAFVCGCNLTLLQLRFTRSSKGMTSRTRTSS